MYVFYIMQIFIEQLVPHLRRKINRGVSHISEHAFRWENAIVGLSTAGAMTHIAVCAGKTDQFGNFSNIHI